MKNSDTITRLCSKLTNRRPLPLLILFLPVNQCMIEERATRLFSLPLEKNRRNDHVARHEPYVMTHAYEETRNVKERERGFTRDIYKAAQNTEENNSYTYAYKQVKDTKYDFTLFKNGSRS